MVFIVAPWTPRSTVGDLSERGGAPHPRPLFPLEIKDLNQLTTWCFLREPRGSREPLPFTQKHMTREWQLEWTLILDLLREPAIIIVI